MNYKTSLLLCSAGLVLGASLFAQDTPKTELFGGYSYFGAGSSSGVGSIGLAAANLNGWNSSAKINVTRVIGLLADFSGNYGDRDVQLLPGSNPSIQPGPGYVRQHTFLFGPEFRVLKDRRFTVNLRALLGVASRNTFVSQLSQPIDSQPPLIGASSSSIAQLTFSGGNGFAASFGGSIDYRINDRLSYRMVQPELLLTHFAGSTQPDLRVSTGVVFTLGRL